MRGGSFELIGIAIWRAAMHILGSIPNNLLVPLLLVGAQQTHASALFEDHTPLQVSLTGPLHSLFADKDDRREFPFALRIGESEHPVRVRVRGKSRARLCRFPPLRLNLGDGTGDRSAFSGHDTLRLVTHCRESAAAEADVLEEYAAYRIFNVISDIGHRVRLLRITYSDSDGRYDRNPFERLGFVIEPTAALARRVGGERARVAGVKLGSLDNHQAALVYVFQYLIGNTDWSLVTADGESSCCHNIRLVDIDSKLSLVPYDFDLTGLVNARYAMPDSSLRISSVTQRLYRGYCISTDALGSAITAIKDKKAAIIGVISQLPELSSRVAARDTRYLERFFTEADNPARLIRSFDNKCL